MKFLRHTALLAIVAALNGCSSQKTCFRTYSEGPAFALFVGFTPQELDTIIVREYTPGSNRSQLVRVDTVRTVGLTLRNDTAWKGDDPFAEIPLYDRQEKEVILPALQRVFWLANAVYANRGSEEYTTTSSCMKGAIPLPPQTVEVDGIVTATAGNKFTLKK